MALGTPKVHAATPNQPFCRAQYVRTNMNADRKLVRMQAWRMLAKLRKGRVLSSGDGGTEERPFDCLSASTTSEASGRR